MVLVHDLLGMLTAGQDTPVTLQWKVGNGSGSSLIINLDNNQVFSSSDSQGSYQIDLCKNLPNKQINCYFMLQDLMNQGRITTDVAISGCGTNLDNHKGNGYVINCAPGSVVTYNLIVNFF